MNQTPQTPLAERMRPQSLDKYIGQQHVLKKGASLRSAMDAGMIPSMILWGPPGVGKTTLAYLIAKELKREIHTLSAISSGVKDVREIIQRVENAGMFSQKGTILFIDEIHRFSKAQQDSLLGAVEKGTVTLIGATTENPSFEVISALLSRCQVYTLQSHGKEELLALLEQAISEDVELKKKETKTTTTTKLQLDEYFNGKRTTFKLPLNLVGTDFQINVWNELLKIPFGVTRSYKEQALAIGNLKVIRAVATANGENRISIIVPCHRIIGSDGSLTGYGGGIWRKQQLLELESTQTKLF